MRKSLLIGRSLQQEKHGTAAPRPRKREGGSRSSYFCCSNYGGIVLNECSPGLIRSGVPFFKDAPRFRCLAMKLESSCILFFRVISCPLARTLSLRSLLSRWNYRPMTSRTRHPGRDSLPDHARNDSAIVNETLHAGTSLCLLFLANRNDRRSNFTASLSASKNPRTFGEMFLGGYSNSRCSVVVC